MHVDTTVSKKAIPAGQYLRLHASAREGLKRLTTLSTELGWQSVAARGVLVTKLLALSVYRVVITGRSRAGKSTLLNALIGRRICPSQKFVTTAVPIVLGPGAVEFATVYFNGKEPLRLDGPINAPVLAPYADQRNNRDNEKGIRGIEISVPNEVLELGVSYIDVAGLDDSSEVISSATAEAVSKAHALIVVLDVSPHKHGGFAVDGQTLTLLKAATKERRPTFVICNKVDILDSGERAEVKRYILECMERAGIQLATGPFLLSAEAALAAQESGHPVHHDFSAFKESVWEFLWNSESIGLRRLHGAFEQLEIACEEINSLIHARRASAPERTRLRAVLNDCHLELDRASEKCVETAQVASEIAAQGIVRARASLLLEAQRCAEEAAQTGQVPRLSDAMEALHGILASLCVAVAESAWEPFRKSAASIESQVTVALLRLRRSIRANPLQSEESSSIASLFGTTLPPPSIASGKAGRILSSAAVGGGTAALAIGAFATPVGVAFLLAGAAAFAFDHLKNSVASPEELLQKLSGELSARLSKFERELLQQISTEHHRLKTAVSERMNPFIDDLAARLDDIRELSPKESALFEATQTEIASARTLLVSLFGTGTDSGSPT